jgi:DNA-directed RNA polymerase subunit RPC12/RpoP
MTEAKYSCKDCGREYNTPFSGCGIQCDSSQVMTKEEADITVILLRDQI